MFHSEHDQKFWMHLEDMNKQYYHAVSNLLLFTYILLRNTVECCGLKPHCIGQSDVNHTYV